MLVVADVHLGNHSFNGGPTIGGVNHRFTESFKVMEEVLSIDETLVIAGDLFDLSTPTMAQLGRFGEAAAARSKPVYILMGNHDSNTFAPYDNALAPLIGTRNVVVVTGPGEYIIDGLTVFLCPYPHKLLDQDVLGVDVAIAHAGIADESTPEFLMKGKELKLAELDDWQSRKTVSLVMSGDWHKRTVWVDRREVANNAVTTDSGNVAIQIGALVPTGWDNPGFGYGSVWNVRKAGGQVTAQLIPAKGPRFFRTAKEDEAKAFIASCERAGYTPYVKFDGYVETPLCDNFQSNKKAIGTAGVHEAVTQVRSLSKIEQIVMQQVKKLPIAVRADVARVVIESMRGTV